MGLGSRRSHHRRAGDRKASRQFRDGAEVREKRRFYLSTVPSRHPPAAAASTLNGKMAATTAERMTDQRGEAEAAGGEEEGGGLRPRRRVGVGNGHKWLGDLRPEAKTTFNVGKTSRALNCCGSIQEHKCYRTRRLFQKPERHVTSRWAGLAAIYDWLWRSQGRRRNCTKLYYQ